MADLITYTNKDDSQPTSDPRRNWTDTDANEVKTVVNNNAAVMLNLRGDWDNTEDKFPDAGGSGPSGVVKKWDCFDGVGVGSWEVVTGDGAELIPDGTFFIARVDNPGQDPDNWKTIKNGGASVSVSDASETVKGIVEEATDAETAAGTATGGTGAQLFVPPDKLATRLTPATQAEMITGTDNVKPATAKSIEDKGSVKLMTVSNSATGATNIDCQGQDTVHIEFTTTVTGAIEITTSNDSNLQILNVTIPITGANIGIEVPSTTRMARSVEVVSGDGWYESTKILQVSSVGTADTHELSFKRKSSGPTFELVYSGPSRA